MECTKNIDKGKSEKQMTENEYNLIKTIENKSRYVLGKMAVLEEITNPKELMFLHNDIEKILEKIVITLDNKIRTLHQKDKFIGNDSPTVGTM